jgi:hypothetical protein
VLVQYIGKTSLQKQKLLQKRQKLLDSENTGTGDGLNFIIGEVKTSRRVLNIENHCCLTLSILSLSSNLMTLETYYAEKGSRTIKSITLRLGFHLVESNATEL